MTPSFSQCWNEKDGGLFVSSKRTLGENWFLAISVMVGNVFAVREIFLLAMLVTASLCCYFPPIKRHDKWHKHLNGSTTCTSNNCNHSAKETLGYNSVNTE
nr:uncharacterized protein LOC119167400 [Rhipicephalus microplus]